MSTKPQHIQNNNSFFIIATATSLITVNTQHTAMASDFNVALRNSLREACGTPSSLGGKLGEACSRMPETGPVGGVVSSIGASPESAGVFSTQQRSESVRKAEEKKLGGTFDNTEHFAQRGDLQLPPVGGASPDIVLGLGSGASVFLSAGAFALNHYNNRFEDGYEAQLPTVTVGADYRVNEWLLAGVGFNYTNYDGTYDDGGGFNKHIFGPLLYATFMPFQGAFADVVLGYARQENRNNRLVRSEDTSPDDPPFPVEGHTSADYSENQYIAGVLAGYDHSFGNVIVGPRLGLAFSHEGFESIKEDGDTGLKAYPAVSGHTKCGDGCGLVV